MKVTLKTLSNKKYELEVTDEQTVQSVKEAANSIHKLGAPEQLKLIYTGKILKNDQTIASAKIVEGSFIVAMVCKKKPSNTLSTTQTSQSAAVDSTPASNSSPAETSNVGAQSATQPSAATAAEPEVSSQSGLVQGSQYEEAIVNLMNLGFERPIVVRALQAGFNNPERAAEYLFSGIPESVLPSSEPIGSSTPSSMPPVTLPSSALPTGSSSASSNQLSPTIEGLQQILAARPELVDILLNRIAQSNPQLMEMLGNDREGFAQLLQTPHILQQFVSSGAFAETIGMNDNTDGGGGNNGNVNAQPNVVQITEQERQALERLGALGFSQQRVLEAFLACDKNEEMAANYLFDHGHDDEESASDHLN